MMHLGGIIPGILLIISSLGFFCDNEVPMDACRRMLRYRMGTPTFLNVWRNETPAERSGLTDDVGQYDSKGQTGFFS